MLKALRKAGCLFNRLSVLALQTVGTSAVAIVLLFVTFSAESHGQNVSSKPNIAIWERSNLVAWCIVPFDSQRRTPEQRVAMLKELGIRRFAYDFRAEHLPTFDRELQLLSENQIELTAVWFPTQLNDDARFILQLLKKHKVQPQLWVMGGGNPTMTPDEAEFFMESEVRRIGVIAKAAQEIGCQVALYNHGNWFGEPENQLAIIQRLKMPNVGIVYNLHHGHHQLDKLPSILQQTLPHLLAVNLNGMRTDGDRLGHKILPIGEGDRDLEVIRQISASGYRGPIGILNHTNEDAKLRLEDNLDGLEWCLQQLRNPSDAKMPKPIWRSYQGSALYQPNLVRQLAEDAAKEGNASNGLKVFIAESSACLSCHAIGKHGGRIGPELTQIGAKRTAEHVATSLLWPSREIEPAFQTYQYLVDDGRVLRGFRVSDNGTSVVVRDPASGADIEIARSSIEEEKPTLSVMPEALVTSLTRQQQLDLIAFVSSLGRQGGTNPDSIQSVLEHARSHKLAEFPLSKGPMVLENHPYHTEHINRDRVYDFYAKQAEYFRTHEFQGDLLGEYPGLDGRDFGHWGNQDEAFWAGNEWNDVKLGSFQCQVYKEGNRSLARGVCVRLGDSDHAACFDPETAQFVSHWKGGFLSFSSVRHGFLDGVRLVGEVLGKPQAIDHGGTVTYLGFYRFDDSTVFSYRVNETEFLDSASIENGTFVRTRMPSESHPLKACRQGGVASNTFSTTTRIELGSHAPYAIDTIELPLDNPWHTPFFGGDLDFLSDGSLYVSTMHGDVWHVSGFDSTSSTRATWRRFAFGLHQPLGVVVHNDQCYVLGRNQITRLHDLNGDGEADWYECFSNAMTSSAAGHDFICGLQRDSDGNLYTASGNQGLLKISPDGKRVDVLATGFRNPDGLGLLPDGSLSVPCSEGDWTATSMICLRKPSQVGVPFYGHRGPEIGGRPELPALYLPRGLDNSSGGQTYISSNRWGPLKGGLVHLSHGTGTAMHVMLDEVDGQTQGAACVFPGDFRSGVHRGRFSPKDGQLYVVGMGGWGSYAPDNGCLQRLRYAGKHQPIPIAFRAHENGIAIRFSEPLSAKDKSADQVTRLSNHFVQAWNYRYSASYGSAEYSSRHVGMRGHDRLTIKNAHLLDEQQTLFLELPDLQPVNQLHVRTVADGRPAIDIYATIHRLASPRTDIENYQPVAKQINPHPIELDLARALKRKPNPWRRKMKDARAIDIEAGQNLSFSVREIRAKPGEPLALTFKNPDVVPHNWALIAPGSLQRVGDQVNRLISDPDAALNHYIPDSPDVICYTDIIEGQDRVTVYFNAPEAPGRYPYLCTFPGHWMVMNGEMIVEK